MIRTAGWKYVHRYPTVPHELYNMVDDPGEDRNLIDNGVHQSRVEELKGRMEDWFVRYVDPDLDGSKEPVTGKGQLDLSGYRGPGPARVWRRLVVHRRGRKPAT